MSFTISKKFAFSASHQLLGLPEGHPCGRLHGHNYTVELILSSENLDKHGFVLDYNLLKPFQQYLDMNLDHRHLNEVLPGDIPNPTAELIAGHLYNVATSLFSVIGVKIVAVRVSETEKTWAEYRP